MKKNITVFSSLTLFCLTFASCMTLSTDERRINAEQLALQSGLQKTLVKTDPFLLTAFYRIHEPGQAVRIYIEGDGYAWVTPSRPSGNPTPRDPVGLKLTAQDDSANVVYLARPCQYTPMEQNEKCEEFYWTNGRFSEEVIQSINQAVTEFVLKARAPGIEMVGYSGGAAVAILVAARRGDILNLRTVAGNLDPEEVNRYHHVSPLDGSLDPTADASKIATIPQIHFVGGEDEVIPYAAVSSYFKKKGQTNCFQTQTLPEASHSGGWAENWKQLLSVPVSCRE